MVALLSPLSWIIIHLSLTYPSCFIKGKSLIWNPTSKSISEKILYKDISVETIVSSKNVYNEKEGGLLDHIRQKRSPLKFWLIRIVPTTKVQLALLQSLKRKGSNIWIQFWRYPDVLNRHTDFWITHVKFNNFLLKVLTRLDMQFQIIDKDLADHKNPFPMTMANIGNFNNVFHSFNELRSEMMRLVNIYDDVLSLEVIGESFEGRPIHVVHLRAGKTNLTKPIIFVLCGSHPREWLAVSACQYTLRRLVFNYKYDDYVVRLLEQYNIAMVPMLNPDGYTFTREKHRLWRKTRSGEHNPLCKGVDLNRNFNIKWGTKSTTFSPCSHMYCGQRPFSESESLAIGRYVYRQRRNIAAFLDIHTYGQMWMSPWGYTTQYPRDHRRQKIAMKKIHNAIKEETGEIYQYGPLSRVLYHTSGSSTDWVYNMFRITHTYAVELRPEYTTRSHHFRRPPRDIIPTGRDLFAGLKALAVHMMEENRNENGNDKESKRYPVPNAI